MEDTPKKSGWRIFFYLTPVYVLLAIPLVKWTMKNQSGGEVTLSKEEYNVFNSAEGEIKKADPGQYKPQLTDNVYTLHYRSGGTKQGTQEELDWGYQEGYLTQEVGKNLRNPKAIDELFNNQWVVKGFMSRKTVRKTLLSRQALQDFLENTQAADSFLTDPVVKSALGNTQIFNILAESDLAKALLAAGPVQELMEDPEGVASVLESNPRLKALLRNPRVKTAILSNQQAAPLTRALGWK
ncbi:MAG: hypothetical protein A2234_03025 [Elusimicrobia bacterium RIFOXYA2_FULL_58_8]|nr:MAG: hypothetical protein A2285_00110 [Elusimicrobia bacterium RIFOXYA12_FULL_57_11]OGS12973.1 MAG: hypothetical protein A2234_03025 [Elusimicrobia bacterium RIFOXYA2_FULL_58_8]